MLRVIKGRGNSKSSNIVDFQKALAQKRLKLVKESTQDVDKKKQPPEPAK